MLLITFIIYVIFHPSFRRIRIETSNISIERYVWFGKKPFANYPLFRSWTENGYFSAFVCNMKDVLQHNDSKIEIEIK